MSEYKPTELHTGMSGTGLRDHNERLVLSLIQRHGALPSADIARRIGLSAQTASVITRSLERDGLLKRGEPVRGRVGKPSVPLGLHPDGAFAVGLRIGRRGADLILMDLVGAIRGQKTVRYAYPTPAVVMAFAADALEQLMAPLDPAKQARFAGIGVAAPFDLWNWLDRLNAPKEEMNAWRDFCFTKAFSQLSDRPVVSGNDATVACIAEHVTGRGADFADYAYFYIGDFCGGGVVLNGMVYPGRSGNAGAFGSLPVAAHQASDRQLIHHASLHLLERQLAASGLSVDLLRGEDASWTGFDQFLHPWLDQTAHSLALAAVSAASVIDFQAIVIDGDFPTGVRSALVQRVAACMGDMDTTGIVPPQIVPGSIGPMAGAMGAAHQVILSRYLLTQTML
ncbi:ROK family transcriptional regulator [Actibacterium sp. 188UL27-1]|uniref:ROK family transcriptional regulator n=1 Tax=Actibacterium sp. 188UL27-1 TaxID=2786961 RepID=UPI00195C1428|nr:ROK family transcriptional regulator [Actibacterium sp. 188UL27-1]MBM7067029.1 ROK family transcriptional regulator [Actibacterium sp. 188UL27-1]